MGSILANTCIDFDDLEASCRENTNKMVSISCALWALNDMVDSCDIKHYIKDNCKNGNSFTIDSMYNSLIVEYKGMCKSLNIKPDVFKERYYSSVREYNTGYLKTDLYE